MEKIRIAACDDNELVALDLKKMIIAVGKDEKIEINEVDVFISGKSLIEKINLYDVVFLDIEMPEMNGIDLGKKINVLNPNCKIIIATGNVSYFKEAFQIKALRYITKPFHQEEIAEALNCIADREIGSELQEVFLDRNKYLVKQIDIQYIKAFNGYTEYYVSNQLFRKDMSLNEAEKILDGEIFYKINRQFIINLRWIKDYVDEMIFFDDFKLKLSRRRRKEFLKKYIDFDIKYGRKFV